MPRHRRYFPYPRRRVDYLTHISRRHDYVYVEIPKAGCSVVKRVLQHSEVDGIGLDPAASVHDRSKSPLAAPLTDGFDVDVVFGPDSPYFRFSFVRNPYTRALSCYLEKIAGEQWLREIRLPALGFAADAEVSFAEFLHRVREQDPRRMDTHWAPQSFLLSLARIEYGFLGRFETFQRDLLRLVETLDLQVPVDLLERRTAHVTGADQQLRDYYNPETVSLVREIYREDFERLGYGIDLRFAA